MVALHAECIQCHRVALLKMVNFTLGESYLSKNKNTLLMSNDVRTFVLVKGEMA